MQRRGVPCIFRRIHREITADCVPIPRIGGVRGGRDVGSGTGAEKGISRQNKRAALRKSRPGLKYLRFLLLVVDLHVMHFCIGCSRAGRVNSR
jgi:hypothetical protein